MTAFAYKALDRNGAAVTGRLDVANRQEACRQLEGRGLTPVNVAEEVAARDHAGFALPAFLGRERVPRRVVQDFTHLLSNLLQSGIPLSRALRILVNEASSPAAKKQWKGLHDAVVDGCSLADAMARCPATFSAVYVAMVRAGETGGFLDLVLSQVAEVQSRDRELRSRVLSALIYPAVLLALAIGVLVFLLVFFIPRFEMLFEDFDAALPLLTRMIVAASALARRYGLFVAAAVALAALALQRWLSSPAGRRAWHRAVLRLPVIGALQARFAMTRFCRMFGTLIGAGVPLVNALRVARQAIGNQTLTDAVDSAVERVQKGESLAASLRDCPALFPSSVIEMVSVAEETSRLDKEFVRVAASTETELDRKLRTTVALAEPLILFIIAALIGTIFIGMVVPIFSLQDHIR